jgi:hypothetical protein
MTAQRNDERQGSVMKAVRLLFLAAALLSLMEAAAHAAGYQLAPIVKFGDVVGATDILTGRDGAFEIGALNDNGQISLVTENTVGGELLIRYSNGTLTPIVAGGGAAAGGQWPATVGILSPVDMNQLGDMAFSADFLSGGVNSLGTFLWNAAANQLTAVATRGMPLTFPLTFDRGGNWLTAINNSDEVAFTATVGGSGDKDLSGDFFLSQDQELRKIALPDDFLPDGTQILDACNPSLNDAGVVAFSLRRKNEFGLAQSAYLWQDGIVRKLAPAGTFLPGGKQISNVVGSWVNNKNSSVLVAVNTLPPGANPTTTEAPVSLYRWNNETLTPVVLPGQTMPDGSTLLNIQDFGISHANDLGQHAFLAILDGGMTAAYLINADGTLSLILKSGTTSNLGLVRNVGEGAGTSSGIALNNKGQVVLTALLDDGVDTVYLLTPSGM